MLPVRKRLRLKEYDYSQNGCYFVTVCTKDRQPILGEISGWGCSEKSSIFSRPCIVGENGSFLPLNASGEVAPVGFDAHIEPSVGVDAHIEPSVGVASHIDPQIKLSYYGQTVERYLRTIPGIYAYTIMPNHVHLMITIDNADVGDGPMWASAPTGRGTGPMYPQGVGRIRSAPSSLTAALWASAPTEAVQSVGTRIRSFKALTSKTVGFPMWQRSYYDHVIRSEAEMLRLLQYIQANPAQWADDEYYQT